MEEQNNCIIIKYCAKIKEENDEERCFVLDEFYSKIFKTSPINELEVSYSTSNGYDCEYAVAKLYFIEAISRHTHDEIKRLFLADDEKDYIIDVLNNSSEKDIRLQKEEDEEDDDDDEEEDDEDDDEDDDDEEEEDDEDDDEDDDDDEEEEEEEEEEFYA
jgi:hypothetical protein